MSGKGNAAGPGNSNLEESMGASSHTRLRLGPSVSGLAALFSVPIGILETMRESRLAGDGSLTIGFRDRVPPLISHLAVLALAAFFAGPAAIADPLTPSP